MKAKAVFIKNIVIMTLVLAIMAAFLTGCGKNDKSPGTDNVGIDNKADNPDGAKDSNVKPDDSNGSQPDGNRDDGENTEDETKERITINIAALKGPTGIGMVKLMEDAEAGLTANDYNFTVAGEADVISTGLIKGEFDIAAVPCNLASVLYNKTQGKIRLAGINTLGVLYILETGNAINTVEDLRGKTIYSTGLGTTPQYTLNYLLNLYGIDPEKDLTIEYKTESTEVAAMLENADDAVAMLPQPYVTTVLMNNEKARIALDIDKEWKAQNNGNGVVTGVVVVRSDFLNGNTKAVEEFLKEYEQSTEYVNSETDKAAELVEKFGLFKAAVAKKAIPYCNITLIRGSRMREMTETYLEVLYGQNPNAVGGAMPADDFYYINE